MRIKELTELPLANQKNYVEKNGVCVADKLTEKTHVLLYQVDDFYVEIQYDKVSDEVIRLTCVSSSQISNPYLQRINMTTFYKKVTFIPFSKLFKKVDKSLLSTAILN